MATAVLRDSAYFWLYTTRHGLTRWRSIGSWLGWVRGFLDGRSPRDRGRSSSSARHWSFVRHNAGADRTGRVGVVGAAVTIRERRKTPAKAFAGSELVPSARLPLASTMLKLWSEGKGRGSWGVDARYVAYVGYETLGLIGLDQGNPT